MKKKNLVYNQGGYFGKKKMIKKENIKLHLGCGKRYIPGFIHIDQRRLPHVDYVQDVCDLSNFKDNSIDLIYSCHLLEHFKRVEINKILAEWYRVLKKGATLRIAVPGFEEIIKIYKKYKDLKLVLGPIVGGQDYEFNSHYMIFDFKTLKEHLKIVGFKRIKRFDWRTTEHAHIDDYSQAYIPHMDKDKGMPISLNVEAIK